MNKMTKSLILLKVKDYLLKNKKNKIKSKRRLFMISIKMLFFKILMLFKKNMKKKILLNLMIKINSSLSLLI